ncbi:MAG: hypothetical protein GX557_00600 [Chloroflexi bacterium]|nr:hypothetical protein [Chloroflexota bacterium]
MIKSVQIDNLRLLDAALASRCDRVRVGSEFCEQLLPTDAALERAYAAVRDAGKPFVYVTPRLSVSGMQRVAAQLAALESWGGATVVANDYGTLNVLARHPGLTPHLGRHLVRVPDRSPWAEGLVHDKELTPKQQRWLTNLYAVTSLNYAPTLAFYRERGVQRVDLDWAPRVAPALDELVAGGLQLSVLLQFVPATMTRKCHMARFLGEESHERCSRPCQRRAFMLKSEILKAAGLRLFLVGNAVFREEPATPEGVADLAARGVSEVVVPMGSLTRLETAEQVDAYYQALGL